MFTFNIYCLLPVKLHLKRLTTTIQESFKISGISKDNNDTPKRNNKKRGHKKKKKIYTKDDN